MDFLKPLFVYRKYAITHDVLRIISNPTIYLVDGVRKRDEPKQEVFKIGFNQFSAKLIIDLLPDVHVLRIREAFDILEKREHIESNPDQDMNLYTVWCTKKGEQAFNDGYYYRKAVIVTFQIVSGIVGGLVLLSAAIIKLASIFQQ